MNDRQGYILQMIWSSRQSTPLHPIELLTIR
jgi:hypothetical protein